MQSVKIPIAVRGWFKDAIASNDYRQGNSAIFLLPRPQHLPIRALGKKLVQSA
ncbi:MAG: hypothetical protein KME40_08550 [Komarekiella atlantica HA4396-MV6]|nr:hypothetical protein [Komarekiella atlantica HA4396-MV6]